MRNYNLEKLNSVANILALAGHEIIDIDTETGIITKIPGKPVKHVAGFTFTEPDDYRLYDDTGDEAGIIISDSDLGHYLITNINNRTGIVIIDDTGLNKINMNRVWLPYDRNLYIFSYRGYVYGFHVDEYGVLDIEDLLNLEQEVFDFLRFGESACYSIGAELVVGTLLDEINEVSILIPNKASASYKKLMLLGQDIPDYDIAFQFHTTGDIFIYKLINMVPTYERVKGDELALLNKVLKPASINDLDNDVVNYLGIDWIKNND